MGGIHGDVAYIPLTQGKTALVDAADYEWLSQWKWYAHYRPEIRKYYAERSINTPKPSKVSMHRAVAGEPEGLMVDHINGHTLDNRRVNLRPATNAQNQANRATPQNNTSGHSGVCWDKRANKWLVRVGNGNRRGNYVGRFSALSAAIAARNAAFVASYKEYARVATSTEPPYGC